MENTYWNRKGAEQQKYDEMMEAGFALTEKTKGIFHSYYRYFNDGDFPGWARKDWTLRKMGMWGWELNNAGLEMQERRVTEAIVKEYARFIKRNSK